MDNKETTKDRFEEVVFNIIAIIYYIAFVVFHTVGTVVCGIVETCILPITFTIWLFTGTKPVYYLSRKINKSFNKFLGFDK